jgi:hypothetical protein
VRVDVVTAKGRSLPARMCAIDELAYLQDLSAALKAAVSEGKSYADAQKEIKAARWCRAFS